MSRRSHLVAVVSVVALLASACTSGSKSKALPSGARVGGHLTVGILEPHTIAPWLTSTTDPYGTLVVQTMCDQMLALDPDKASITGSIAEGWRLQTSKQMTLTLRKGLKFPDGSAVTPGDIIDSISRAARADVASPAADVLKVVSGADALGGLQSAETNDPRTRERLAGVTSSDPTSLDVNLTDDRPDAFRFLAHPITSVVPSKAFRKDAAALEHNPSCVGPYQLAEPWQPTATTIKLVRSHMYDAVNRAYTLGGRGLVDSIDFKILPDRNALYGAYTSGAVDIAYLPGDKVDDARARFGADIIQAPSPTLEMIGLPTTKAPFDKPNVRAALSVGLDRQAIIAAVHQPWEPSTMFLPETLGDGYSKAKLACRFYAKPTADMAVANKLLSEVGVDLKGTAVKLTFNDEFGNRALVDAVAKQWEAAFGLHVDLNPVPFEAMIDSANTSGGLPDPYKISWRSETSDPNTYIRSLFHSGLVHDTNWSMFNMKIFDLQLDEKANKQVEDTDRHDELITAENFICASMPMIPVAEGGIAYAVRQQHVASAAGRFTDRATGQPLLREIYLKES